MIARARHEDLAGREWLAAFRSHAHRERIPVNGLLELTSRCNLRCVHCYLGPQAEQHAKREQELSTHAVRARLDEMAAAGCLILTITGGDPMMRKDFPEIYRHARTLGMIVTVYCDGILVTDRIIELFRELPPRKVEVSLYGATESTYEAVTRVPGSHARALAGIQRLRDAGIRVALKTVLMKPNAHELDAMAELAAELGLPFRFDAAIFPCLPDHGREPLDLRVAPEKVVEMEMSRPEWRDALIDKFERAQARPESDQLYTCGAGASAFYMDPFGNLSPCLLTTHYRSSTDGRSMQDIWDTDFKAMRTKRRRCGSGEGALRGACTNCPASNFLETGDEEETSGYMRRQAEIRRSAILGHLDQGAEKHVTRD